MKIVHESNSIPNINHSSDTVQTHILRSSSMPLHIPKQSMKMGLRAPPFPETILVEELPPQYTQNPSLATEPMRTGVLIGNKSRP
jgi:hypothetical protein